MFSPIANHRTIAGAAIAPDVALQLVYCCVRIIHLGSLRICILCTQKRMKKKIRITYTTPAKSSVLLKFYQLNRNNFYYDQSLFDLNHYITLAHVTAMINLIRILCVFFSELIYTKPILTTNMINMVFFAHTQTI